MGGYCCSIKRSKNIEEDIKSKEINYNEENKEAEKLKIKANIKKLNYQKKELEEKIKKNKKIFNGYNNDIQSQIINIAKYKKIIESLNCDFNEHNSKIITSQYDLNNSETNNINNEDNELFVNEIKNISSKINDNNNNIEKLKKKIINMKSINNIIEEKLNEINENENKENNSLSFIDILETNNEIIYNKIIEFEESLKDLEKKKNLYNYINKDIEKEIEHIKNKIKEYVNKTENKKPTINEDEKHNYEEYETIKEPLFLDNSMLLTYNITNPNYIYSSKMLFNEEINENNNIEGLFRKNWNEIVYIYNDFDLHDISFDLTAVNIPLKTFYDSYNIGFNRNKTIEIIEFKIDENFKIYNFDNNNIKFDIHLGNNETNKIVLKYKEYPIINKLTDGEIKERQFFRNEIYGLSKKLKGQKARFTIKIKCDFEVINFEDEFLIKIKEKEYTWGGIVPQSGKKTCIKLSKLKAKFSFSVSKKIETINKQPIAKCKFVFPLCFEGGNNKITKIIYSSNQTNQIQINKDKKEYEINFTNIKENFAEFTIEGELINRCTGEWNCDLTDEEIEKEIPHDYRKNKDIFRKKAEKIIEEYNLEHKDDIIQITDFAKIGKWIKNNIKYDENYIGKNDITASETLYNKKGVCDHFTKLYNAFIYSLGYQCIYISGYVIDKRDIFEKEDYHCWTLIKVEGKWLPFDVTWGIFSGKLPVSHIFDSYFSKGLNTRGSNRIKFVQNKVYGKFLE